MDRRKGIILLVQGAKRHLEGEDPEQQLRLAGQSIINILQSHSWHHHD